MGSMIISPQLRTLVETLQERLCVVPPGPLKVIGPITCSDGLILSVQASTFHACFPRRQQGPYQMVEVYAPRGLFPARYGFEDEDAADDERLVYRHVPIDLVAYVISSHGGISPN